METEASPSDGGHPSEVQALARTVARLRAEVAELRSGAAAAAVVERARGYVMRQRGVSAEEAHDLLRSRARRHGHGLMEECWITLGHAGPDDPAPAPAAEAPAGTGSAGAGTSTFSSSRYVVGGGGTTGTAALLAELADRLLGTRTPSDVAELLRGLLDRPEDVAAVLIYTLGPAGSLELAGHAGVDSSVAEQWRHIPPLTGFAPFQAVTEGRALWLEDPARDGDRYLLIGGARPDRWLTRAWIPLAEGSPATTVVGFLRTRDGRFDARTRTLLRRAVRLCGGVLRGGPPTTGRTHEDVEAAQRVLDVLPGPAVLLTPMRSETGAVEDFRIDAAAPESVDVAGRRGKELVGRTVLETYPTLAGAPVWNGFLRALATGTAYESEPFAYEEVASGVPRRSLVSVRATRLGDRLVASWSRHDEGEREARRLADMQRLGNLGWALWDLVTDTVTWSDQVYAIFGRDRALGPMTLEELPGHLLPEDLPGLGAAVRRLLDEGLPVDHPCRITVAGGVRHLRIVAEATTDADGVPLEVHGFFQDLTAQRDAEIARSTSERAVLVQQGMLEAERALAARLQDTLLPIPEQSLELADLSVDVAYLPADSKVSVGGDWYSAIELPDGSVLFVVGDVAGHGLTAVGTMAQLRFTAKGMAITGSPLPEVLGRLNNLLLHTGVGQQGATATMVIARYRPWNHRLTWARAGHLPPLLVRGGEARFLPQPSGVLLGGFLGAVYEETSIDLRPGDHLLLYTDGLVERPGETIDDGLDRLAADAVRLLRADGPGAAAARADLPAAPAGTETCAAGLAALRPEIRDDLCVLDIHLPARPGCPRDV